MFLLRLFLLGNQYNMEGHEYCSLVNQTILNDLETTTNCSRFYISIIRDGRIWILNFFVRNVKRYQLRYKVLSASCNVNKTAFGIKVMCLCLLWTSYYRSSCITLINTIRSVWGWISSWSVWENKSSGIFLTGVITLWAMRI